MSEIEIKHFKNQLNDYQYLQSKIKKLKEERLVFDTRRGVHAVRYDKEPSGGSPDKSRLDMQKVLDADKSEKLNESIRYYQERLNYLDRFMSKSKYGASIKMIHCLGTSTYDKEARRWGLRGNYKDKTLQRIVNKEIEKFLNNVLEDNEN